MDTKESDECFDVSCTICAKKNRAREASHFCVDCQKNLCGICADVHVEHNEHHSIIEGHGKDHVDGGEATLTEKCERHPSHLIELFCVDHNALACSLCDLQEHRGCKDVKHIVESVDELLQLPTIQITPDDLESSQTKLVNAIECLDEHVSHTRETKDKLLTEIDAKAKSYIDKITILKLRAQETVAVKGQQVMSEAEEKRTVCVEFQTKANKCFNEIKDAANRKAQSFILKMKWMSVTENIDSICEDSKSLIQSKHDFPFLPNNYLDNCLKHCVSLGRVEEKYTTALLKVLNVKADGETKQCDILGSCLLPDGTLVVTDFGNQIVKCVDFSTGAVISKCAVQQKVLGITRLGPLRVAVCTFESGVCVLSYGDQLRVTGTLQLDHSSYRILHQNGEVFTSAIDCLYIYGVCRSQKRQIWKDNAGKNLFISIQDIAVNRMGDRIFVVDKLRGLICVDRKGNVVFTCSCKELGISAAFGICMDDEGHLFICGLASSNVVQVTEKGHIVGEILSSLDGISNPKCLCMDAATKRLYVAGEMSKCLVFQLS